MPPEPANRHVLSDVSGRVLSMPVHLPGQEAADPCPECGGVVHVDLIERTGPRKAGERHPRSPVERLTCQDCGWSR